MIQKRTFDFLIALKETNTREWFQSNKSWYMEAKDDFESFVNLLINEIRLIDPDIGLIDAPGTIFRIYRDVRFSKDKSPYKTNMGSHIVPGGKKSGFAGYYFHLEPGGSFSAGGIYLPSPETLKKVRREIYENYEEFISIINARQFYDYFGRISGEKLINPPQGFPKEFPHIDLLKYKSYTVSCSLPDEIILSERLLSESSKIFRAMYPFNRFINYCLRQEI